MNSVEAAEFSTLGSYIRPIVAILLFFLLAFANPDSVPPLFILANLLLTFIAVFALRAIYFALIEESRIQNPESKIQNPKSKIQSHVTGAAVGVISVIGFTPDIFFAPITGRILDASPGYAGFQHYFLALAAIVSIGLLLSFLLSQQIERQAVANEQ